MMLLRALIRRKQLSYDARVFSLRILLHSGIDDDDDDDSPGLYLDPGELPMASQRFLIVLHLRI